MHCLVCGSASPDDPCSFHSGRPIIIQNAGASHDYKDVYRWSCCNKTALSEIVSGSDVPPCHGPGCTTEETHLLVAPILICYSPNRILFAEDCRVALEKQGFDVTMMLMSAVKPEVRLDSACVAIFPDQSDAQRAIDLADSVQTDARPPWVVVCNPKGAVEGRSQSLTGEHVGEACNAICHGVRMYHGRLDKSPFNIFLSYRRADKLIATVINQNLSSWWDQHTLSPGVDWASEIEFGVRDCELFVVLLRGELPAESYVWRELDLAIKYKRSVAVLAFGDEGIPILARLGIDRDMLQWCEYKPPCHTRDTPLSVGRYSSGDSSILYFNQLSTQMNWPLEGDYEWSYPRSEELLRPLKDFPKFQFYSTDPWIQVWDLMEPLKS